MELVLRPQLPRVIDTNMWPLSDLCVDALQRREALGHGCVVPDKLLPVRDICLSSFCLSPE